MHYTIPNPYLYTIEPYSLLYTALARDENVRGDRMDMSIERDNMMSIVNHDTPVSGPPSLRQLPRRRWISTVDALWLVTLVFGTRAATLHHFVIC